MCLYLKKTFASKEEAREYIKNPPLTKRKRVVWKALEGCGSPTTLLKAPYNNFFYEKGNHYYQTGRRFTFSIIRRNERFSVTVSRGLHACIDKRGASRHGEYAIQMIIPKGSVVFVGSAMDIVTDNLIWE